MKTLCAISPIVMWTATPSRPNQPGSDGDEDVGVDREEEHLEDRVERHQAGAVLGVALGEVVPDDDHRDAARQADQDEPHHVLGLVAQEDHRQREHEDRADHPVLHEREREHSAVPEDPAQLLVADLRQRRVHHEDEADGDRDGRGADVEPVDERHDAAGTGSRRADADAHGEEDPERQVAVEERQPGRHAGRRDRANCRGHGRGSSGVPEDVVAPASRSVTRRSILSRTARNSSSGRCLGSGSSQSSR